MSRGKELDKKKKRARWRKQQARMKGGAPLEEGYTSYGYLGTVDRQLIEVVSPEELYELLENDG